MDCLKDGFVEGLLLEGRYKTVSPLNHGSFGMVFLAKDLKKNELVAIKCLAKSPIASPRPEDNLTDHLLELLCHDRLGHHPHVVNLMEAFETKTHMFLVLEYCPQGDLYEAIRMDRGPQQTENVRECMLQLINAVEFMHSKGLYHRDIKPENIFLAQDGSIKLGDFGLSTTETWTYEASVGSDRYMAPEQYEPGETGYNPAQADVWAVGICLLNILFSRNPFVAPSESDVLFSDFKRDRESLFDVFPALSQDTFKVLTHALAMDPEKRSLSAMRDALDRVLSFTTDEEVSDDDFCNDCHDNVPAATTASRQPLRTPSVQSPPVEQGGAFPWARALQLGSPIAPTRQLSVIPDVEPVHAEPTFVASSFQSGIDSALGASIQSITLREPKPRAKRVEQPLASSAPSQPVPVPQLPKKVMASVYANDVASKSWSDLWDEEAEESEAEAEDARRAYNNLNWSSDALNEEVTVTRPTLAEIRNPSATNTRATSPKPINIFAADSGDEADSPSTPSPKSPLYSPPAKRTVFDKWAALGNRRRAAGNENATPKQESVATKAKTATASGASTWRRGFGLKAFSSNVSFRRNNNNNGSIMGNGNILGTFGARISNSSLADLPTTPGSIGLGLQQQGVTDGTRSTGRGKARRTVNRKAVPDGLGTPARVRARNWRPDEDWLARRDSAYSSLGEEDLQRASVASRDEIEWVGGWKDLQL